MTTTTMMMILIKKLHFMPNRVFMFRPRLGRTHKMSYEKTSGAVIACGWWTQSQRARWI